MFSLVAERDSLMLHHVWILSSVSKVFIKLLKFKGIKYLVVIGEK